MSNCASIMQYDMREHKSLPDIESQAIASMSPASPLTTRFVTSHRCQFIPETTVPDSNDELGDRRASLLRRTRELSKIQEVVLGGKSTLSTPVAPGCPGSLKALALSGYGLEL